MRLSVVIPALNAERELPATLACLEEARHAIAEIVVSDGGSSDGARDVAKAVGCRVIVGSRGRGSQLRRGAELATGEWLLFLHADTRLDAGWSAAAGRFAIDAGDNRAAAFAFALDDDAPAARRLERMVRWRGRLLALPYGDQGLLISRALYDRLGGYADAPLMEDVDLVRRIGRRRLTILPVRAVTSAARYRRDGYLRRMVRNALCLTLYLGGVSPARIARLYG
ncbi:rSAM/selenodomain-associated transferase 2 [Methylopila capsulata]|uniref:Glycosyl transferase n=1 Tax=Methylopila capsulata TaxID=61654 RepID=A0A9W6ISY5_9HYPH|nr:TIGR04283 family arsenosugar biosynthesis glycosyltransferase [Methylopila capsulata]MBM7850320.1 rSAM/selenodomain-associated transferase 2 [Methylopila capsulata]GLK55613.1 glycosyl transferase [Methylopila capsulata]